MKVTKLNTDGKENEKGDDVQRKRGLGEKLEEFIGEEEEGNLLTRGDINIKTNELGGRDIGRNSYRKDKVTGNARNLAECFMEKGWYIVKL
jgi:hypothetical protein